MRSIAMAGLMAGPATSSLGAPRVERPHYELALNGDPKLCPKLKDLYNRLLTEAIRRDSRSRRPVDLYLTNFAVNHGTSFAQIGLRMPAGMKNGPLDGVQFYTVTLDGESRTIAVLDWYRGNFSLFTTIGVLRSGIGPLPITGGGGPMLPVPSKDIQIEVPAVSLPKSQEDSDAYLSGEYLLKKWPGFSRLYSAYNAWLGKPVGRIPPLPAISGAGLGLTIRPFQSAHDLLYFVFDSDIGLRQIRDLSARSGWGGLTLVQRLTRGRLEDVCYLVLAPSALAAP